MLKGKQLERLPFQNQTRENTCSFFACKGPVIQPYKSRHGSLISFDVFFGFHITLSSENSRPVLLAKISPISQIAQQKPQNQPCHLHPFYCRTKWKPIFQENKSFRLFFEGVAVRIPQILTFNDQGNENMIKSQKLR